MTSMLIQLQRVIEEINIFDIDFHLYQPTANEDIVTNLNEALYVNGCRCLIINVRKFLINFLN